MRMGRITVSFLLVLVLSFGIASAEETTGMIIGSRTAQAFTDEPVSEEDLRTILEAGLAATSAINDTSKSSAPLPITWRSISGLIIRLATKS